MRAGKPLAIRRRKKKQQPEVSILSMFSKRLEQLLKFTNACTSKLVLLISFFTWALEHNNGYQFIRNQLGKRDITAY